jgi:hypothetical protein
MGITISSKNHSIDMGCGGFNRLRNKVAELTGKEIGEHYAYLDKGMFLYGEARKMFFSEYNKKISELEEQLKIPHGILDFLYASDCEGKITYGKCKQIYKAIENYDDDILYGYCGRSDCAKFKDFKEIVKDCINNKCSMEWY